MTTTITVTTDQWEKKEDDYFHTQIFVNEVLENKPIIQIYQNTNDKPKAYNMVIPYILRVVEIPEAERGFFINIALPFAINGHVAIR